MCMKKCFEMFGFDFANIWPINKSFVTHCSYSVTGAHSSTAAPLFPISTLIYFCQLQKYIHKCGDWTIRFTQQPENNEMSSFKQYCVLHIKTLCNNNMVVLSASMSLLCDSCYVMKCVNSKWQYLLWFCLHKIRGKAELLAWKIFTQFSVWWNEIYSSFLVFVLSSVLLWGTPSG